MTGVCEIVCPAGNVTIGTANPLPLGASEVSWKHYIFSKFVKCGCMYSLKTACFQVYFNWKCCSGVAQNGDRCKCTSPKNSAARVVIDRVISWLLWAESDDDEKQLQLSKCEPVEAIQKYLSRENPSKRRYFLSLTDFPEISQFQNVMCMKDFEV